MIEPPQLIVRCSSWHTAAVFYGWSVALGLAAGEGIGGLNVIAYSFADEAW
jgi:hypothetical protein